MACRSLFRIVAGSRRQRCTVAAPAAPVVEPGCPFVLRNRDGTADNPNLKPYEAIPTAKALPLVGTTLSIVRHGGAAKMHEYIDMRHRQLGPIFREKLGPVEAVAVSSKELASTVYLNEGRYPQHMVPEPWLIYNQMRGIQRGLFFMDGEEWYAKRSLLNRSLLNREEYPKYGKDVTGIVEDLIKRWDALTLENGGVVPNLETELYNWSIETLGTIVFGRRLGCVAQPGHSSEMEKFVYYVQKIFGESAKMSLFSPKLAAKLRLPVWKRFEEAADNALTIARRCTEQRIEELKSVSDLKKHGVIGLLLSENKATLNEIVNIVADLIIAAADTTSHATQWALYSLAKNPECQEKLVEQINQNVPKGEIVTDEHIEKIPYLLWVVRETLRLYPIAPFLTRISTKDYNLGGYNIPAGTLVLMSQYTMGRNPESFSDADQFVPERWERQSRAPQLTGYKNVANGCMPFGGRARSCIGKRVAEMKMRVLIARAVQKYRIESKNDVEISLRMITTPDKPVQLSLHKRDQ